MPAIARRFRIAPSPRARWVTNIGATRDMTRICTIAWLGVCICSAQQAGPRLDDKTTLPPNEFRELAPPSAFPRQGNPYPAIPIQIEPPTAQDRPNGESVSLAQLQHKVPRDARKLFARATKLSKADDHEGAAKELESAVRMDPEFADAYERLGMEYGELRRPSDAAIVFRRLLELKPDSADTHCYLGLAQFQMGDRAQAGEQIRLGLRQFPASARCQFLLGYLEFQREATRADGIQRMQTAARTLPSARKFVHSLR